MIVLGVAWLNCESLLKSMGRMLFRCCGMDVEGGFIGKVCPVRAAPTPCLFRISVSYIFRVSSKQASQLSASNESFADLQI